MGDFIEKGSANGSAGSSEYGLLKVSGEPDRWAAVCPRGFVFEAPVNNMSSAANLAREMAESHRVLW